MSFRPALRTGIKSRQLRQPGDINSGALRCLTGDLMSSKIQTYAELQKMFRKALREQHPEWIDADGKCTLCDSYEARFAKLLAVFSSGQFKRPRATRSRLTKSVRAERFAQEL
jgi:S-methylmethionine-dependent homocysteine/selenocysteine methylase